MYLAKVSRNCCLHVNFKWQENTVVFSLPENFLKVTCITYAVLERLFSDVYEILQVAAKVQDSLTAKRVSARLSERRRKPGACRPCQCFKDEQVTHLILIC